MSATFRLLSTVSSRVCVACVIACALAATPLHAQVADATLTGTVTDSSGASIPGAVVTAQNTGTGQETKVNSTADGTYTVNALQPGSYTITIVKQGFTTNVQRGLVLTVGQAATLKSALQVGSANETVTVNAASVLIDQSTAQLSNLVNEHAIKELPLNGRDPASLVLLSPGITNVLNSPNGSGSLQTTNAFPDETGASANGGRQGSTYYLLDGVQNVDTYLLLAAPFPNADATQEFRVITNNFDAQYGFAPGAVVTIQTKSGTNAFHGGLFEFLRNNALNAGNYFSHAVDPLKRNQFGGYFGGPVRKNTLFFFVNYQQTNASTESGTNTTFTPTAAFLAGDFSAVPQTLKGPFQTVNGKPNQVSPSMLSSAALAFAQNLPLGVTPATGQVSFAGPPERYTFHEFTGRLDYDLRPNQRLTVRNFLEFVNEPQGTLNGNVLTNVLGYTGHFYNELVTHTWTISSSSVNVLSGAYLENDFYSAAEVTNKAGEPVCLSQYIQVTDPPGTCYPEGGISVSNGFGQPYSSPNRENRRTWTLNDDYSKVLGKHTLTLGETALHQFANEISAYPANASIGFNGEFTGFGLADFLLGDASSFLQGGGETQNETGYLLGVYGQDAFRITPNLTVTAGLRWEPNIAPSVKNGRGTAFIPGEQSTRYPNAPTGLVYPGDPGVSPTLIPRDYEQFGPRIGVAWQPSYLPKTAFRGAFGIFFSPLLYSVYNHTADTAPFSPTYSFSATNTPIPFANPFSAASSGTGGIDPFPPFASAGENPPSTATFPPGLVGVGAVFNQNFRIGTTQSWNVSLEQQFGNDYAFHLAYVGNESYHQLLPIDLNPGIFNPQPYTQSGVLITPGNGARTTYPAFSSVIENGSLGTANYNALQASLQKRLSQILQVQTSFTWSRTEDTFSANAGASGGRNLPDPFNIRFNFGKSDFNVPIVSVTNFVYTTPALKGHGFLLQEALGGWEVSGIYTLESGYPFTISDSANNSASQQGGDRANFASGFGPGSNFALHQGGLQQRLTRYFNPAAFVANPPGTFGNTPRNTFQGPGINSADIGFIKNFPIREHTSLQFRWETFNTFNHPNFANPSSDVSSGNFGQITSIGPIAPRVQQAALKLTF